MAYDPKASSTLFTQSADKTVTNTTADTSSIGTGNGSLLLPANWWYPGRQIRVSGGGIYTTPLSSNVTTKVKLGSNTIATSVTNGMLNSQTNARWNFEILIACRSVGTNGAFRVSGRLLFDVGGVGPAAQFIGTNITTPETANTTVEALLDVTNAWDLADANRSVTTTTAVFEVLN